MPAIELVESIDIPILSAPHLRSAVGRYCCKSRKANDTKISRKLILVGVSTAATLSSAGTKVRGRFSLKRCGPSLTSPCAKRISGPKKIRSPAKRDFFNTIRHKRSFYNRPSRERGSTYSARPVARADQVPGHAPLYKIS